jgi:hypothetical protein
MINDLLELARIASGAERPLLDVCEARAIADDAIAAARARMPRPSASRLTLQPGRRSSAAPIPAACEYC